MLPLQFEIFIKLKQVEKSIIIDTIDSFSLRNTSIKHTAYTHPGGEKKHGHLLTAVVKEALMSISYGVWIRIEDVY